METRPRNAVPPVRTVRRSGLRREPRTEETYHRRFRLPRSVDDEVDAIASEHGSGVGDSSVGERVVSRLLANSAVSRKVSDTGCRPSVPARWSLRLSR
ncbi:hypothetical protein EA472_00805 [Natrarchaeobius oligotrophus]|uniref:Uncharacterized protein n=1 Tax=Natrarchaeobius chitinivorans TaxID=1679083 RepID=A0A3N6MND8_NATCH|nr:hypothetical protein EA472_00805 [Natrarchaeobius chitinivorans]